MKLWLNIRDRLARVSAQDRGTADRTSASERLQPEATS